MNDLARQKKISKEEEIYEKVLCVVQKHITSAIFIGLILGILTGLFLAGRFEPVLTVTSLLGSIYMNALNMMIFPLVFCSIIMGYHQYR